MVDKVGKLDKREGRRKQKTQQEHSAEAEGSPGSSAEERAEAS